MQTPKYKFEECVRCEWGWFALRGGISILFGFMAIVWPMATLWALAILWGAFVLTDGIFAFVVSWRMHRKGVRWWPYILFGVTGVVAGIVTFAWPGITAIVLLYIIAIWALIGGINQIVAAVRLRHVIDSEWLLGLAGVISLLFGLLILLRPIPEGIIAIGWLVGFYALTIGMMQIIVAFKIKNKAK